MKVFADGTMYIKPATCSRAPADVVRTVGDDDLPSRPLVEYEAAIRAGRTRVGEWFRFLGHFPGERVLSIPAIARCQLA